MTKTEVRPPSQRSIDYLTDLVKKRQAGHFGETLEQDLQALTRFLAKRPSQKEVSEMIDRVWARPVRGPGPMPTPASASTYKSYPAVPESVPSSKFAVLAELLVEVPDSWRRQDYLFFEVKKLRGRRVIRRLTGAPGRFNRSGIPAGLAEELFSHLENKAFAYTAALTFGEIYEVCGRCGAELTDELSRQHKFGPICWDLMQDYRVAAKA